MFTPTLSPSQFKTAGSSGKREGVMFIKDIPHVIANFFSGSATGGLSGFGGIAGAFFSPHALANNKQKINKIINIMFRFNKPHDFFIAISITAFKNK